MNISNKYSETEVHQPKQKKKYITERSESLF